MHTKVVFPPKTWTRDERTGEIDAHTNSDYDYKIFPARTYCSSGLWPFYVTNFRRMKMCRRKITVGFNEPSPRLFILWLGCYAIPRLSRRQRRRRKCNFIIMKNSTSLVKARKRAGRIPENAKFLLPSLSVFRRQFCFMGTLTLCESHFEMGVEREREKSFLSSCEKKVENWVREKNFLFSQQIGKSGDTWISKTMGKRPIEVPVFVISIFCLDSYRTGQYGSSCERDPFHIILPFR